MAARYLGNLDVTFPAMRAEVVAAVAVLADPVYQQRVWVERIYPNDGFYDDLTQNVHVLFDDTEVLPDPVTRVGSVLRDAEVGPPSELAAAFEPVLDDRGDVEDAAYLADPRWPGVVAAARRASAALTS